MTKRALFPIGAGSALALALMAWSARAAAQAPPPLFEGGRVLDRSLADDDGPVVLRASAAQVRFDRLGAAMPAGAAGDPASRLTLNLFDDVVLVAEFERFETDAFGHQTWVGRVEGDPRSTATFTWKGSVISGGVSSGDLLVRLSGEDGAVTIHQLDSGSFPVELPPRLPPASDRIERPEGDLARPEAGEVVDIFVYYTTAAMTAAGGRAQIEALIAQGVADSNTAFARSGVAATKRLVGTGELVGFVQNPSDMVSDLEAFTRSSTVAAMRDAVGADLMHLVLANTAGGACGVAWLGPSSNYAHGVTARGCFGQYTFTHEVGHNFGNNHSVEDGPAQSPFRPYSFGYKNCGASPAFRTVMAYVCPGVGAARLLNLSNPGVLHNGLVTGTATQNNARSQSEAFPIVQAFRSLAGGTLPSAPQNLQANVSGNTIVVTWQAPAQGTPVSTYVVRAGTGPGLSDVYDGAVGPITAVSSPIPNGTYHIRVLAQNAAGLGPATPDVVASVGVPPGSPQGLVGSASGGVITLSWSAPGSGGTVSTYIVQAGTASGSSNVFNGAIGPFTSVSGTVPPGAYYLRVLAQGPGGTSAPSNEVSVSVGPSCTVPTAPMLSGFQSGGIITIDWSTPSGGPVTSYIVRAGSTSGGSNLYDGGVGLANTVSAPVAPGGYFIRVIANSACGSSGESNEVAVFVP